jgi:hypothetical protein
LLLSPTAPHTGGGVGGGGGERGIILILILAAADIIISVLVCERGRERGFM